MAATEDLRYLESHEWHRLEGDVVTIGISSHAVDELTDITFVELPSVGDAFGQGDSFGEVESVKATSEVYTGVAGSVVAVNDAAVEDPSVLNADPFGEGWLIKIQVADTSDFDALLDHAGYSAKFPD